MEILDQLAIALGFATLAGINLYLTTFITGLAVKLNWVALAERHEDLAILGEPVVLLVSGALLITEVMADKIPWVDSVWDSFHTLIRPVGGGLLAVSALGTTQAEYDVIIALTAGSATLVSHGFKAGTRLVVNNSPEPVSNTLVSLGEDAAVIGGLTLMAVEPKIMAGLCILFLVFAIIAMPRIFRRLKGFYWLLGKNAFGRDQKELPQGLVADEDLALIEQVPEPEVLWGVPVVVGKAKGLKVIRPWMLGKLVTVQSSANSRRLFFIGKRWGQAVCVELMGEGLRVAHEPGLLSEHLVIYDRGGSFQAMFRVPRSQGAMAGLAYRGLRQLVPTRKALPAPAGAS